MTKEFYLSRFTPSLLKPETLEAILVQRGGLATRLVERIRESVLTRNKHYVLLVGPRGIGKTHMVSLLYHRIRAQADLADRLRIAWLREEEWGVASYLDLLLAILRAFQEEYHDEQLATECEQLRTLPAAEAEAGAERLLRRAIGNKTLLVITENLDEIFKGIEEAGQKKLRGYVQNNPVFTILATSQSLFGGVSLRTSPFYGFFQTYHLQDLCFEDAVTMMAKIAEHEGNGKLALLIRDPQGRARMRAVHHLAGGNPRVYVIFSQFLTCESLDDLVEPLMQVLDDLTPYYQARMSYLSPQQRKIVDLLCQRRHAVSVTEIARNVFITHQTASSQLKKLREMGYVRADQVGRESYYELREPLMRISLEVKKVRGEPTRLLIAFLRIWYSQAELADRLESLRPEAALDREYLQQAIEVGMQEPEDPKVAACKRDFQKAREAGDFEAALKAAEELVAIRNFTSDHLACAACLKDLGRHNEAEDVEKKAFEMEPGTAAGWLDRGSLLTRVERYDGALTCFDKAATLEPGNADMWSNRGCVLDRMKRYEEALAAAEESIQLEPSDALKRRNLAVSLERLMRYEDALAAYEKAIELDSYDALVWRYRTFPLQQLNRHEEAVVSCDKAIELDPEDALTWRIRAQSLQDLKCYNEALGSYDKAVELDPGDALTWRLRAGLLMQLNRHEEAVRSFDKAIVLDPEDALTWRTRAQSLQQLKHYKEALGSCDKAVELNRSDALAWQVRAGLLIQLNRHEEATVSCDKAIELDPNDATTWSLRTRAMDAMGRYEEALTSVDKVLEIKPDNPQELNYQAIVLYRLGRLDESLASLEKSLELDPDNANAWENRAVALSSVGQNEQALACFDRSLELESVDFDFHTCSNRAVVLSMLGRWEEGVSELDETLSRFARDGGIDSRGEVAIVRNLLIRTQDTGTWRRHIATWIELFNKHALLATLGQGLVRSIRTLNIPWIRGEVARNWRDLWQEVGRAHKELEIPLRLLDAAVRYQEEQDERILLGLPVEERQLLKPLLQLKGTADDRGTAAPSKARKGQAMWSRPDLAPLAPTSGAT